MTASLAKVRLFEVCAQDRWDCEGTMLRVPFPDRWAWVPYGVVVTVMGRVLSYWNPAVEIHVEPA